MMKSSKPKVLNRLYSFTMKKVSNPYPTSLQYEKRLAKWRAAGIAVILCKFEMAPEDHRLHLHGIIHLPDHIYRQQFFKNQGWHYEIVPLLTNKDINVWTNYCEKDYKLMGELEYLEMIESNDIRYHRGEYPFMENSLKKDDIEDGRTSSPRGACAVALTNRLIFKERKIRPASYYENWHPAERMPKNYKTSLTLEF